MPSGVYIRTAYHIEINRESHKGITSANKGKFGDKSSKWKGKFINHNGYTMVYCPNHPYAISSRVYQHRLKIEKCIGRYLLPEEDTHHLNGIKTDNKLRNLMAFSNHSAHIRFHKNPNNVKAREIIFNGRKYAKNN